MSVDRSQLRRYLLGQMSEDEQTDLEQRYFSDAAMLEAVSSVEEDLVENYLDGKLNPEVRRQFERFYLAASHHRARVETIRLLRNTAAAVSPRPTRSLVSWQPAWLMAAAAVLILAAGVLLRPYLFGPRASTDGIVSSAAPAPAPKAAEEQPQAAPKPPLNVVAIALSPSMVRGRSGTEPLVVPGRTDIVALRLEGEPGAGAVAHGSAVVRTVSGTEVWQGETVRDDSHDFIARVEVPAAALVPDDYIIALSSIDERGARRELYRYFLRVRSGTH